MRLLTCRKDTRSAAEKAGYNAIRQDTRQLQKAVPIGTGRGQPPSAALIIGPMSAGQMSSRGSRLGGPAGANRRIFKWLKAST